MRILAIAYACEPSAGSEPGAGWAWSRMLAILGETWIVTRGNNRPAIERCPLSSLPLSERPHFIYIDLPHWARFWKRGHHGVRLYYMIWQLHALRRMRALQRADPFDVVWHLDFRQRLARFIGGVARASIHLWSGGWRWRVPHPPYV